MATRLKLKLSRVIPSLQICRSKNLSACAETPVPSLYRLSPVNPKVLDITYPNLPAPPPSTPEYRFIKRHVSPKVVSVRCGCRSGSFSDDLYSYWSIKSPDYTKDKEAAAAPWHVSSRPHEPKHRKKIYDGSSDGGISPVCVNDKYRKKQRNKKEKKIIPSVFSHDSDFFSSEEDEEYEETETLISGSSSFSNDSSFELDHSLESTTYDFYNSESSKRTKKEYANIKKIRGLRLYASKNYKRSKTSRVLSPDIESPVKASVLRRMIPCTVKGKVRESMAVVRKSMNPYEDFKRSMLEMILEKEMFEAKDLEELLHCLLSLNSRQYHRIIVDAFSEIWEVLFCDCPVSKLL